MIFLFLSRAGSRSKEFRDFHFQCLCEKVNVFVRGHISLQFDVAEHIAGDAAFEHLQLRHQQVLGQPLLITKPGNLASNEICVASHTPLQWLWVGFMAVNNRKAQADLNQRVSRRG